MIVFTAFFQYFKLILGENSFATGLGDIPLKFRVSSGLENITCQVFAKLYHTNCELFFIEINLEHFLPL